MCACSCTRIRPCVRALHSDMLPLGLDTSCDRTMHHLTNQRQSMDAKWRYHSRRWRRVQLNWSQTEEGGSGKADILFLDVSRSSMQKGIFNTILSEWIFFSLTPTNYNLNSTLPRTTDNSNKTNLRLAFNSTKSCMYIYLYTMASQ